MIEFLIEDRCTRCNLCVAACPMNVFEAVENSVPRIAHPDDCQTCFMCELYCPADALFVGADCTRVEGVSEQEVVAAGLVGQFRRDSGWGEWASDPRYQNEHWRMEGIFGRARALDQSRRAPTPSNNESGVER